MSHVASTSISIPSGLRLDWRDVERGVPLAAIDEFASRSGIPAKELIDVVIPPRTLKHRRQRGTPLSMVESDRLAGIVRIYELALKVYGNREDAVEWFRGSMRRFDGRTPLAMLRTAAGEQAVTEFLIQVDEGYFA
jgi:putative toxin-antitoxin system antitoxin component (TIGR02293 family)